VVTRDGRRIVFRAGQRAYSRSIDQTEATEIPGAEGIAGSIFVSPDGEWVGFNDNRGQFKKIRPGGGAVSTISKTGVTSGGLGGAPTWAPDGTIVFATFASPALMRVSDIGGVPEPLTTPVKAKHIFSHISCLTVTRCSSPCAGPAGRTR
jgi:hypothetical protein